MIFDKNKLLIIAGPCSLECKDLSFTVAEKIAALRDSFKDDLTVLFKGSFDKANRTSLKSPRGPGMDDGLDILASVKKEFSLPVISDIHDASQCQAVGEVCDALQIPAFLCRQTDILVAAAKTNRVVNVKKGQFLSPYEMQFVVSKLREANAKEIWQTERGTTFGYQNLVVDMRSFTIMKENDTPTIFDATHAVQLPGAGGGVSSGERKYVKVLAPSAIAAGADGLFIETHPNPDCALSDAASQLPLSELADLVKKCLEIKKALWK